MRVAVLLLCAVPALAAWGQPGSLYIEDLTWQEVKAAIAGGKSTALYYAGSTEQNGPHMALGKHNVIARYVAGRIAAELGNALVYPVLPYAPTGAHMKFPGTVNLAERTYAVVAREVAESAIAAGFRHVCLMGDHGGGQQALAQVARELDREWAARGVRVHYIGDAYYKSHEQVADYLARHKLPAGEHAAIEDTSELMFLDADGRWIRRDKLARGDGTNGVAGDPRQASAELGRIFLDMKVRAAVAQIRTLVRN